MSKKNTSASRLISTEELNDFEVVRSEYTTPVFKPKITLNYDNVTFNAACVRFFPESEYIQILVDPTKQRLLVWPCDPHTKASVKWSKMKDGDPKSRKITARILCAKLFELMNWNIQHRYKIMAVYQELEGRKLCLFNLPECEMLQDEEPTEGNDDGKKKKRRRVFPLDWSKSFGTPYAEFASTYDVNLESMYLLSDNKTENTTEKPETRARVPNTREQITREYFIPDEIVAKGRKKK